MKHVIKKYILIMILLFAVINITCFSKNQFKKSIESITKIIYHYYDSSVPPKYHRSYTILITENKIKVTVDSYGDILNDKEFEIDSSQFEFIKKSLFQNKIRKGKLIENKGCTGGTSDQIEYFNNDDKLFSASVYHCGNKDYGDLRGDIRNVGNDIKSLIPDFKELLK